MRPLPCLTLPCPSLPCPPGLHRIVPLSERVAGGTRVVED